MSNANRHSTNRFSTLPPLILHPFTEASGSRQTRREFPGEPDPAGLAAARRERGKTIWTGHVLEAAMCEIRMLFYVGRDLIRWIEQCLEFIERLPEFEDEDVRPQDLMHLLISNTPREVEAKLARWGVGDFRAIFSRGLGLHSVFKDAPVRSMVTAQFVRNYYRYADQLFWCLKERTEHLDLRGLGFTFDLYASGEYTRMLEAEWSGSTHGTEAQCRPLELAGGGSGGFDLRAGVQGEDVVDLVVDVHARELGPEHAFRGLHAGHPDTDLVTQRKGVIE